MHLHQRLIYFCDDSEYVLRNPYIHIESTTNETQIDGDVKTSKNGCIIHWGWVVTILTNAFVVFTRMPHFGASLLLEYMTL